MVANPGSLDHADSDMLIQSLRERLRQALVELGDCRARLVQQGANEKQDGEAGVETTDQVVVNAENFSCVLSDHTDILGPFVDRNHVAEVNLPRQEVAEQGESVEQQDEQPEKPQVAEAKEEVPLRELLEQQRQQHEQEEQELVRQAATMQPGGSSSSQAAEAASDAVLAAREQHEKCERDRRKLEEDLSMAKALLMLSNVHLNMDFDRDESGEMPPAQTVSLKGNRKLVQALITLKQKVSLLNQQYLLLRGDMLYLSHEMNVCRHWVLQSFKMAMQHQSQEHSSGSEAFKRSSKHIRQERIPSKPCTTDAAVY